MERSNFKMKSLSLLILSLSINSIVYADIELGQDFNDISVRVNADDGSMGAFIVNNGLNNSTVTFSSSLYNTTITAGSSSLSVDAFNGIQLSNAKLSGIQAGLLDETSTEVVVGAQLYTTNTNVSTNTNDIATNRTNIATNTANITTNTNDIATNRTNIATNTANITTNTNDIATNRTNIATNTANITTNTNDIATNKTKIASNSAAIALNTSEILNLRSDMNSKFENIDHKLDSQKNEYRAGIASLAAMSNIPNVSGQTFSVGFGIGQFRDQSAIAAGANWNLNEKVATKLSLGFSDSDFTGGAGIAFGF
ncbi:YadA C-terminal domain-containing protein [Acinetobacter sp.]|jgi:YadA-like membrane anchor domain|uniref:YadA C-terminal domain-containing protein n=1 Tax=Acinetobacter sp. TaxID=472 RepID=UPI00258C3811|nr:YadA C-terminal domain-containing protein [Acinetobacter sp.]